MATLSSCPRCRGRAKVNSRGHGTCPECGLDPGQLRTIQASVSRRGFLKLSAGVALAGFIAGCASSGNDTANSPSSSGPATGGTNTSDARVQSFTALSALITGVDGSKLAGDAAAQLLPLIDQHVGSDMTVDHLATAAGVTGSSQGTAASLDAALGQPGAIPPRSLSRRPGTRERGPATARGRASSSRTTTLLAGAR